MCKAVRVCNDVSIIIGDSSIVRIYTTCGRGGVWPTRDNRCPDTGQVVQMTTIMGNHAAGRKMKYCLAGMDDCSQKVT